MKSCLRNFRSEYGPLLNLFREASTAVTARTIEVSQLAKDMYTEMLDIQVILACTVFLPLLDSIQSLLKRCQVSLLLSSSNLQSLELFAWLWCSNSCSLLTVNRNGTSASLSLRNAWSNCLLTSNATTWWARRRLRMKDGSNCWTSSRLTTVSLQLPLLSMQSILVSFDG